jgi:hypothetical protein
MTQHHFQPGGIVVFWHAGDTRRDALEEALKRLGLEKFTPEARTPYALLKEALEAHYTGSEYLVRALDDANALAVTKETKGLTQNDYAHIANAKATAEGVVTVHSLNAFDESGVQQHYDRIKNVLHPTSATTALVKIVAHLNGTALRPQGGIYWLHQKHEHMWSQIVSAFQSAGQTRAYTLRIKYDEDLMRAVTDALLAELNAELDIIKNDVADGDLGERALKTRQDRIDALTAKLQEYEGFLGTKHESVHDNLKAVKRAAISTMLMAAGANEQKESA